MDSLKISSFGLGDTTYNFVVPYLHGGQLHLPRLATLCGERGHGMDAAHTWPKSAGLISDGSRAHPDRRHRCRRLDTSELRSLRQRPRCTADRPPRMGPHGLSASYFPGRPAEGREVGCCAVCARTDTLRIIEGEHGENTAGLISIKRVFRDPLRKVRCAGVNCASCNRARRTPSTTRDRPTPVFSLL